MSRDLPQPDEAFEGSVQVTDWIRLPWGDKQVIGLYGKITFHTTQTSLGFEMAGGGHANWMLTVEGENHTYVVPGCKVQNVVIGIPDEGLRCSDFGVVS